MGCCGHGGGPESFNTIEVCGVCKWVDNDESKKNVRWCDFCEEYICRDDWNKWKRRNRARQLKRKWKKEQQSKQQ